MAENERARRIEAILKEALAPEVVEIHDDSARHAHHAGTRELGGGGETHFNIMVISRRFNGMSRIARHRLVHDLLAQEFSSGLHALSLVLNDKV
ncbi:stress response and cell division protein BolA [Neoasaia chiangmaiensis NBRC 101099]|uniref:BolA family transcriptional regulator n=1 Tax=Neoasaia chiangmaiensis TaxID=320497 RepID=A0A1U9KMK6_9PROT|nr:BolA family protein [Neoasaia chiangmaiensis]AQS87019.1 BolA family transcriptional regulator [Neoasaia chiangmaiensis]GBR37837.1 stress response and cell division protein BolA [Neoasaia chiangmaiensis NBRC 101099]GEN15147.1 BolA family transcriptional regulator [Neoasaia chiangmaiensis]